MAKFCGKNLKLGTNDSVYFGDSDEAALWYDGSEFRLDHTISGTAATADYHLIQKGQVDTAISGAVITVHSGLSGLGADDHTQYSLVTGTRAFTGTVGGITPTADNHLTTKQYVDSLITGLDWQDSVLSKSVSDPTTISGVSIGDRYIIGPSATGVWAGNDDNVAEWNGTSWDIIAANEGFAAWVEDEDVIWVYNGTAWVKFGNVVTHANLIGLDQDDHTQYILEDGTRAFSGTVSGINPTASAHLTTKWYVDQVSGTLGDHGNLTGLADDDHTQYVPTNADRGFTATVSGIDPTLDYHLATKWYVDQVSGTLGDHGSLNGLGDDDHTQYILVDGTRGFTATVSGITPTDDNHLATKWYVDDEVATLSGTIPYEHDQLIGLADDDHVQYILVDGTRGFTATVSGIDPVDPQHLATKWYVDDEIATLSGTIPYNHDELIGLGDDDHTQYILVDGTRGFTATVSGITPTDDNHLATKWYVDDEVATLSGTIPYEHDQLIGLADDDHVQYILVNGTRGFTATVSGVDPTQDYHLTTKNYVDSICVDKVQTGREQLATNDSSKSVTFPVAFADTNYSISAILSNTVDGTPCIYPMVVSAKSTTGFTVTLSGDIDSNNYYIEWIARHD